MAVLADLFVRIRADAKQALSVETQQQKMLARIDSMKVQPKIVVPDISPQIKAMQAKLTALSRTSVNLSVNKRLITAEVEVLRRQLDQLVAKKRLIPIHLQDKIDKEIAHVRTELAQAERKQTNIPLKLERVDAKIAAVKKGLATLTKPVDVPVKVDQGHTIGSQMGAVRQALRAGLLRGEGDMDGAGRTLGRRFGGAFTEAMKGFIGGALVVSAVRSMARGFANAVNTAGQFERQMRLVGVVAGEAGGNIKDLTRLAIKMGNDTVFSASEASDAMLALAKGGLSSAQIKAGALSATLTLAAAGGLDLGNAANYMVQGLSGFGLQAKDAGQVAAALAGAANASTASVEDMGIALAQVGPGARIAGLSIQDTTAALAAFSNAGFRGSDAGTSLKTFLSTIVPKSHAAETALRGLGIITKEGSNRFFDAAGNVKSLADVSQILQDALRGQTAEQIIATNKVIFGSDAQRAATILTLEGADGIKRYTAATNDQTQAQTLAQTMMAGYAGALERVKGVVETTAIQFGTKLLPATEKLFNFLSNQGIPALAGFGGVLTGVVLPVITTVANVLGSTLLGSTKSTTAALIVFLAVLSARKIAAFGEVLVGLGARMYEVGGAATAAGVKIGAMGAGVGRAASVLGGPWGIAIGIGITALISWATKSSEAAKRSKDFTDTLTFQNGALDENSRKNLANQLAKEGTLAAAIEAGVSEKAYTDALLSGGPGRQAMIDQLSRIASAHKTVSQGTDLTTVETDKVGTAAEKAAKQLQVMGGSLDKTATEQAQAARAAGDNADATDKSANAATDAEKAFVQYGNTQDKLKGKIASLRDMTQKLIDKFTVLKNGALDQESANNAWQQSLDEARKSLGKNSKSLDQSTKSGRTNREVVVGMIRALNDKITADFKATEKTKGLDVATRNASKALKNGTADLWKIAKNAGVSRDAFDLMIKKMLKTPKEVKTETKTPGLKTAQQEIDRLRVKMEKLKARSLKNKIDFSTNAGALARKYHVSRSGQGSGGGFAGGGLIPKPKLAAGGGVINGTGGPKADNIVGVDRKTKLQTAWVSAKEFVVNAAAYAKNKAVVHAINAGKKINAFVDDRVAARAGGGTVSRPITVGWNTGKLPNVENFGNAMAAQLSERFNDRLGNRLGDALESRLKALKKKYDAAQAKLTGGLGGGGGKKMSGSIISIARRFHPSYIAGHRDPQGGPAYDIGSSGAKNNAIANALRVNHARLGLRYVISQMRITSARSPSWRWRRYTPITGSGDFRHVGHVHVSYANGGLIKAVTGAVNRAIGGKIDKIRAGMSGEFRPRDLQVGKRNAGTPRKFDLAKREAFDDLLGVKRLAAGAVVRGGRGGVLSRIGEGGHDELVQPLPRSWKPGKGDDKLDRLITLIERNGIMPPTINYGDIINPAAEPLSVTTNKTLQRVASVGLVG